VTEDDVRKWPWWVHAKSRRDGDCLVWLGEYDKKKCRPIDRAPDGRIIFVKPYLMGYGENVKRFKTSCQNGRCLSPWHQEWSFKGP
jgi:hypothetical protein